MEAQPEIPTWLMTLIAAGFFGGLGAVALYISHRRLVGFEQLAERRGLQFYRDGNAPVYLPAEFLDEIERGIVVDSAIRRALVGAIDGVEVALCEVLRYRQSSSGSDRSHYSLAVALFALPEDLPRFSLAPEKLRHKLTANARESDINFADSPRSSRRYLLRGDDETRIRNRFTERVREFLDRHPRRCARCYGKQLVYYRPVRLLKWSAFRPGPTEQLLDEGLEFVRALHGG